MKLSKEQHMITFNVFDIKRFAVHDGEGLRTTIFFKGCPLRCKWCQNPEGLSVNRQVIYMSKQCIHCRICEKVAYDNQMYYDDRPYFKEYSTYDNLIKACPSGAIQYDSKEYSLEELMSKIKEDQVFFRDNGGVTFSGGEPFMQGDKLLAILKECKKNHIHTAIESSFYAPLSLIKEACNYLDIIYCDCKAFDENQHIKCTNVSNKIILENIHYLLTSEHKDKVIIRTPLIPTMNADDKNIENIAKYISNLYKDVKYELLNYNPLASSKYELVNLEYGIQNIKPFTSDELNKYYDLVRKSGVKNLIFE